jgi:hypothetical protein
MVVPSSEMTVPTVYAAGAGIPVTPLSPGRWPRAASLRSRPRRRQLYRAPSAVRAPWAPHPRGAPSGNRDQRAWRRSPPRKVGHPPSWLRRERRASSIARARSRLMLDTMRSADGWAVLDLVEAGQGGGARRSSSSLVVQSRNVSSSQS